MKLTELKYCTNYMCKKVRDTASSMDTFIIYAFCVLYEYLGGKENITYLFKTSGLLGSLSTDYERNRFMTNYIEYRKAIYAYYVLRDSFRKHCKNNGLITNIELVAKSVNKNKDELQKKGVHIKVGITNNELVIEFRSGLKPQINKVTIHKDNTIDTIDNKIVTVVCGVCDRNISSNMMNCLYKIMDWDKHKDDENIWRCMNY